MPSLMIFVFLRLAEWIALKMPFAPILANGCAFEIPETIVACSPTFFFFAYCWRTSWLDMRCVISTSHSLLEVNRFSGYRSVTIPGFIRSMLSIQKVGSNLVPKLTTAANKLPEGGPCTEISTPFNHRGGGRTNEEVHENQRNHHPHKEHCTPRNFSRKRGVSVFHPPHDIPVRQSCCTNQTHTTQNKCERGPTKKYTTTTTATPQHTGMKRGRKLCIDQ